MSKAPERRVENGKLRRRGDSMEISWDCVWGMNLYRVQYADALSLDMTWNTFPGIVDGTGLERASYPDTSAGGVAMRFYRVMEYE
jgi:hypothetical protein